MKYIVNTHSLVWYFAKDKKLSNRVKTIIQQSERGRNEIIIPVIVLVEVLDIQEKKKVRFDLEKLFNFIDEKDNFLVINLDFAQVREMVGIGKGLDLHDRIILTVAKVFRGIVLTKDPAIQKLTKTIW